MATRLNRRARSRVILEALEERQLLTSVLTYHNDNSGRGVNSSETVLTTANVNASTFGKLHTTSVDGQVYAQTLVDTGVTITTGAGGVHDVVYVATMHDSVYAMDAHTGAILWQHSFLGTGITSVPAGDTHSTDITVEVGITSTPVIDTALNSIFVVTKTKEVHGGHTHYVLRISALDLGNGSVKHTSVVADTICDNATSSSQTYTYVSGPSVNGTGAGNVGGKITLNALLSNQRVALSEVNGVIYFAVASHGDFGPYHGWVLGYNASDLSLKAAFNVTPNGSKGGIWMGGGKITADSSGNLYVVVGNGSFDTTLSGGFPNHHDFGESVIKLAVDTASSPTSQNGNGWGLKVVDYFTPHDEASLNSGDKDIGADEALLLPSSAGSSTHPNLLFIGGKGGTDYLIDQNAMGHFNSSTDNIVQEQTGQNALFTNGAFFNGSLYIAGVGGRGQRRTVSSAHFATTPNNTTSNSFGFPGSAASVSSNGTSNGIVWFMDVPNHVMYAYRASDMTPLWNSGTALGSATKFEPVTIANGLVYIGTQKSLVIFGLL